MSNIIKTVSILSIITAVSPSISIAASGDDGDWSGAYAGAHGALVNGKSTWAGTNIFDTFDGGEGSVTVTDTISGNDSHSPIGGGLKLGYNHQIDNFVVGIEADVSFFSMSTAVMDTGETYALASTAKNMETIRGRAGFAFDNVLVFGTAGIAFANLKHQITTASGLSLTLENKSGWTIGGGAEVKITPDISVSAMVQRVDMGSVTGSVSSGTSSIDVIADTRFTTGTVGLNFHF